MPRYAVVRFENLSGDAALEWVSRGASELLSRSLSGVMDGPVIAPTAILRLSSTLGPRPGAAPGISTEGMAAQLAGANRVISGYVERSAGGVRVTGVEQDMASGMVLRTVSIADPGPMKALTGLAHALSGKAGTYETGSEEAFRLYCLGREETPENAAGDFEKAVQLDPHFGPAWDALVEITLARGDRPGAEQVIARAREQKPDKLTLANLDLQTAVLRGDPAAQLAALRQVSALSPGDTVLRRSLAESESKAGQFAEAAADWQKLRDVLTTDPDAWNQLGYTRAWSGDYAGAVKTMEGYARLRPGDPNPLDSLGDVHFLYRKYNEAAAAYQAAYTKAPQFQAGGELYKAAWAKFLAGDKAGADAAFGEFRKIREKSGNFALVSGDWLYRTGRQKQAVAELRKALQTAGESDAATKAPIYGQLAVWDLLAGDRAAAAKDAEAAGTPTSPGSFLIRFATLPSAPAAEWEARAARMVPAPAAGGLRQLAVGYALVLDGKKDAAVGVFEKIAAASSPTDFALRAVLTRLKGDQPKLALLPDPSSVNSFAAVVDGGVAK